MQPQELGRVPAEVEDTWNQEPNIEQLRTRVSSRLAAISLLDHNEHELDFDAELPFAA